MRSSLGASPHASAHLASYAGRQRLGAHAHEKPYLSLHLLGAYREYSDGDEVLLSGPAAAMHWPGCVHEDDVGDRGLAAVVIEFDPGWLGTALGRSCAPGASLYWTSGESAASSAIVARRWLEGSESMASLVEGTASFIRAAIATTAPPPPRWIDRVESWIDEKPSSTAELSGRLGVHPAWLARAYRSWRGEGLRDAFRRRRVCAALALLRETDLGLAEVAQEAGFCDQAHMNRAFRAVLASTPLALRRDHLARSSRSTAMGASTAAPTERRRARTGCSSRST